MSNPGNYCDICGEPSYGNNICSSCDYEEQQNQKAIDEYEANGGHDEEDKNDYEGYDNYQD